MGNKINNLICPSKHHLPFQRPSQPPLRTKPNNFYVAKLVEPYCHCDAHLYDPQMTRYKKLADKEKLLHDELKELSDQMAELTSSILEHQCDTVDEKMQTIYQTDYIKRGIRGFGGCKEGMKVDF